MPNTPKDSNSDLQKQEAKDAQKAAQQLEQDKAKESIAGLENLHSKKATGNSVTTQQQDVDGDLPGGRKGKK